MPFIRIELLEGRSHEQKQALVSDITEAVVKHTGAPKENVFVIIDELKKGNQLAQGGQFK
ncbi:2-hydroxymuconate tautomerase family protein [Granulicatella sp. 19428wC4_WM01]|nr:2-hydroxymuconate tautomerase family protein [Granulicatella sp. 19428wC4_WM01]TFU95467.1 4-oxalocrotonate tautomerase [Granulicatella sp. WM01]